MHLAPQCMEGGGLILHLKSLLVVLWFGLSSGVDYLLFWTVFCGLDCLMVRMVLCGGEGGGGGGEGGGVEPRRPRRESRRARG